MKKKYLEALKRVESSPGYWVSAAQMPFTDDVFRLMARLRLSKSELARRMGTSQPYITKALGGNTNFTLQSLAKFALALDAILQVRLVARDEFLELRRLNASGDATVSDNAFISRSREPNETVGKLLAFSVPSSSGEVTSGQAGRTIDDYTPIDRELRTGRLNHAAT